MLAEYLPILIFLAVAGALGVLLLVLVVGFVYEWKKGALEWD
jgi:NADH:ubiquinone oxidoreductase subunit 3 (subunit A)